ncbi:neutral/alkaline non-lysosomal ceramidase N-terminal domain-containing protein [Marinobacteraceae bacterium S3BR75-40.1]
MIKKLLIALVLLLVAGCVGLQLSQPELSSVTVPYTPAHSQPAPEHFVAGAATVDITPPPGVLPRAGYATWSTIGQGFRTRLKARAYYLRDTDGDAQLIMQTDLTSGSRILHTRLGELLAGDTDIDASNLTITTTHTHSAPGQIVGSQFYNKHISNVAGFAQGYFDFLLERLRSAALEAYRNRQPARIAIGHRDIWGLTRNRSVPAYVENNDVENKSTSDERAYHDINPRMFMVRLDRITDDGGSDPLGAFASFSIHGTALPADETLFNADVWAYVHGDWARAIQADHPVTVSAFEGMHGDVAPASRFGMLGYIEARRVGKAIAKEAIALYQRLGNELQDEVDLATATRHINIREHNRVGDVAICKDAAVGNTLAAAPQEHTSPVIGYLPFIKQGSRRWGEEEDNCQGRKRILGFSWGQPLLEPKDSFPDYVLFQLIRINDLVIAPLPFELTTETGRRLAEAVQDGYRDAGHAAPQVMMTSLAGGYTGYVTTPKEYGRQYYEGGHTLYGKNTQPYLAGQLQRLARDFATKDDSLAEMPTQWTYRFEVRRFLPVLMAATGNREVISEPRFSHPQVNEEGHWQFRWQDVNPSLIALDHPLLSIEVREKGQDWQPLVVDGVPVNDQGYDLAVRLSGDTNDRGMATYTGYWYNPVFAGEDRDYRFVVASRDGRDTLYSPLFH